MPVANDKVEETLRHVVILVVFGVVLIASNSGLTVIDDETKILPAAAHPRIARWVYSGVDLGRTNIRRSTTSSFIFWLPLTAVNIEYVRAPAILSYCLALFLLTVGRLGGAASTAAALWLGALWPFGFHYGRLATWCAVAFPIVSGLKLA